jgi:uncharacterized membrane protein SirB2
MMSLRGASATIKPRRPARLSRQASHPTGKTMLYLLARHLHMTFVAISITLFLLRGVLMMADSSRLRAPVLRITPHVVDTLLLASALWLVSVLHLPVLQTPWLMAKIIGLLVYIGLGSLALRPGRSKPVRVTAFVAALVTVGWIVSVAVRHDPLGFLGPLLA